MKRIDFTDDEADALKKLVWCHIDALGHFRYSGFPSDLWESISRKFDVAFGSDPVAEPKMFKWNVRDARGEIVGTVEAENSKLAIAAVWVPFGFNKLMDFTVERVKE